MADEGYRVGTIDANGDFVPKGKLDWDDTNDDLVIEHVDSGNQIRYDSSATQWDVGPAVAAGDVAVTSGTFEHTRSTVTSATTTSGEGYLSVDASGGAVTVTLASEDAEDGKELNVKRNGGNTVTLETEGSETIEDASSYTLDADGETVTLVFNADTTDWEVF